MSCRRFTAAPALRVQDSQESTRTPNSRLGKRHQRRQQSGARWLRMPMRDRGLSSPLTALRHCQLPFETEAPPSVRKGPSWTNFLSRIGKLSKLFQLSSWKRNRTNSKASMEMSCLNIGRFLIQKIIQLDGPKEEGIFRISIPKKQLDSFAKQIEDDDWRNLEFIDAHQPAALLKRYLRNLEEPLIPDDLYNDAKALAVSAYDSTVCFDDFLCRLPEDKCLMFKELLELMIEIADEKSSQMDVHSLAVVMAPAILRPPPQKLLADFKLCAMFVELSMFYSAVKMI